MQFTRIVIAAAVASTLFQPAAAAPRQLELEPSAAWTLNYDAERCNLMREFGTGDSKAHLEIISFGSWNRFQVFLTGPALHKLQGSAGTAKVQLTGDAEARDETTFQGKSGKNGAILFGFAFSPPADREAYYRLPQDEKDRQLTATMRPSPDYDATVNSMSVRPQGGPTIVMKLGSMATPLEALRTCVDDLVKSWGGDPDAEKTLSRNAVPLKSTVNKVQAVYPEKMLNAGINGFVPVRLSIDATGNASNCVIQLESVDKAFAKAVCDNLTGKFEPALDKDGKPVPTIYHTRVVYRVE
jgi:hypothetical protein